MPDKEDIKGLVQPEKGMNKSKNMKDHSLPVPEMPHGAPIAGVRGRVKEKGSIERVMSWGRGS